MPAAACRSNAAARVVRVVMKIRLLFVRFCTELPEGLVVDLRCRILIYRALRRLLQRLQRACFAIECVFGSACGFFELCLVARDQGACNACATQLVAARPAFGGYMPASGFFCWGVANWFVEGKPALQERNAPVERRKCVRVLGSKYYICRGIDD